ncbi:MAG: glycogen synthase [Candidatus Aminicenantes bacterium]|nr:glycogen synthase [Candidatus Aminicenantes bacterium]
MRKNRHFYGALTFFLLITIIISVMNSKLSVIYVSAEASPYAKSGELADVASSLPKYLSYLGMDISVFLPKYRLPEIESLSMDLVDADLSVPFGESRTKGRVFRTELGKYRIYFIDCPKYFWREAIYGTGKGEYLDNDERFVFFNRAVAEYILKVHMPVDVIHCNNWPTALIPLFLATHYGKKVHFKNTGTVLTLHNISYQGDFPPETLALTGLNWEYINNRRLSLNGKFNFLKAGILYSDVLNTVSYTYKREIMTPKHGFGLDNLLRARKDVFFSIRNGVDYEMWNPEKDPFIAANYSASNFENKLICKHDLIREFGISVKKEVPVVGIASYMTANKGFDILLEAVDDLMRLDIGLVILGQGDEMVEKMLLKLHKKYPQKMGVKLESNPCLTHKIAAGADIFLIPSRYEPCGLNQLYSFRYGSVPLVRATGGLRETVKPFNAKTRKGNGFVFKEYTSRALLHAVLEAIRSYRMPRVWKTIMRNGLRENYSWEDAAKRYSGLYQRALKIKRGG